MCEECFRRIHVIASDNDTREIVIASLEIMTKWEVSHAKVYDRELVKHQVEKVDAMLIDFDRFGEVAFHQLRSKAMVPNIPIILFIPRVRRIDRIQLLQQGVTEVIQKPFDTSNLGQKIVRILKWPERCAVTSC